MAQRTFTFAFLFFMISSLIVGITFTTWNIIDEQYYYSQLDYILFSPKFRILAFIFSFSFNCLYYEIALSTAIGFIILSQTYVKFEKKNSTLYMIFDTLFQNLLINVVYVIFVTNLGYTIVQILNETILYIMFRKGVHGWYTLSTFYLWKYSRLYPNEKQFMGVKNKVIKWIFFVFILFISGNFMSIIFATLSATLQTLNQKQKTCNCLKNILKKIESKCCCSCLLNRSFYIASKIDSVQEEIELKQSKSHEQFEKGYGIQISGESKTQETLEWKDGIKT